MQYVSWLASPACECILSSFGYYLAYSYVSIFSFVSKQKSSKRAILSNWSVKVLWTGNSDRVCRVVFLMQSPAGYTGTCSYQCIIQGHSKDKFIWGIILCVSFRKVSFHMQEYDCRLKLFTFRKFPAVSSTLTWQMYTVMPLSSMDGDVWELGCSAGFRSAKYSHNFRSCFPVTTICNGRVYFLTLSSKLFLSASVKPHGEWGILSVKKDHHKCNITCDKNIKLISNFN